MACLLSSVPACRANALTHTVTLAYATGETADVCIAANVCINRTAGLFVLGDATTPSCPPALLVHERADAAFVPRVERGLPRDSVLWSTKQLALVFSRFWPENAGHALHNDLVAVLVTWRRAMLVSGVPYGPDVAQAISLDDFSADPEDYMNR